MTKNFYKTGKPGMLNYDIICVIGPTASGKSELAVMLARKFEGEIISADSRQIYQGMDIGSGKVAGQWLDKQNHVKADKTNRPASNHKGSTTDKVFVYKDIPHYLIDEASPAAQYSAAKFQRRARAIIRDIKKRGKLPIICGGTGHWVEAVIFDSEFPNARPDKAVRAMLSQMSKQEMHAMLQKIDPRRAAEIDKNNPHRLMRALEIVLTTGHPVPEQLTKSYYKNWRVLWIGLNPETDRLEKNIAKRLKTRLRQGMLEEVRNLHSPAAGRRGLSWKKLESFGLEYKYCALYLQNKISKQEMEQSILIASRQYAKRQLTWWKRSPAVLWNQSKTQAVALAKLHLS